MLEVHPPEEAAHSWKDFLLHIGTICVGLLIAIGLEQSVEAIHRAHESRDLREELEHESEQIRKDSESCVKSAFARSNWAGAALLAMTTAVREHRPAADLPQQEVDPGVLPSDPIFRAAMASNRLPLLTRPEVEAYSEMHLLVEQLDKNTTHQTEADVDLAVAVSSLTFGKDFRATSIFAGATAESLRAPYQALLRVQRAAVVTGQECYVMRYAAKTIHDGERDLEKIEAAETAAQSKLRAQILAAQQAQSTQSAQPAAKPEAAK